MRIESKKAGLASRFAIDTRQIPLVRTQLSCLRGVQTCQSWCVLQPFALPGHLLPVRRHLVPRELPSCDCLFSRSTINNVIQDVYPFLSFLMAFLEISGLLTASSGATWARAFFGLDFHSSCPLLREPCSDPASCVAGAHGEVSYLVRSVRMVLTPVRKVRERFGKLEPRLLQQLQQLLCCHLGCAIWGALN